MSVANVSTFRTNGSNVRTEKRIRDALLHMKHAYLRKYMSSIFDEMKDRPVESRRGAASGA